MQSGYDLEFTTVGMIKFKTFKRELDRHLRKINLQCHGKEHRNETE